MTKMETASIVDPQILSKANDSHLKQAIPFGNLAVEEGYCQSIQIRFPGWEEAPSTSLLSTFDGREASCF